jgi:signal transduction histidine kinase
MGAGARSYSVQRPKLALWVVAAACAVAAVGFVGYGAEQLWQLHATDAALRSAIETAITLSALVSAVLLLAHFQQTRLMRDLVLLAALATVTLTDFIFNALPANGPLATSATLTYCVALLVSAFGFARRHRDGDRAAGLLAAAAVCIAGAQLGRLGLGVAPPGWVTPSDALRVAGYGLLLATAVMMYRRSQDQHARDAVSAERLRIARDLHDGLAQDLAFIAAHSERLAREFGADHPLAIAAGRALATSRGQIVDLEASHASNTEGALREVAAEMSARHDVNVSVVVDEAFTADRSEHERRELVRIAREAIANAARHGGARNVTVRLGSRRDDLLLRISDDGCGFGRAGNDTAGTGLGMRTMRARAKSVGGRLVTRTHESGGAEIEVVGK